MVDDDLRFLYPRHVIVKEDPTLQIVKWADFEKFVGNGVPVVTTIALHEMKERNRKLVEFPSHGFVNGHLLGMSICFSGFSRSERRELQQLVRIMGGVSDSLLARETNALIVKDATTKRCSWAKGHQVPIVCHDWLLALRDSERYVPIEEFVLSRRLHGVRLDMSMFGSKESEMIACGVQGEGGVARSGFLDVKSDFVMVPDGAPANRKTRIATALGIPVTSTANFADYMEGSTGEIVTLCDRLMEGKVFAGLKFRVDPACYMMNEVKQLIRLNAGVIVENGSDYDISWVSSGCETRTPVWIERCVVEGSLLPVDVFRLYGPVAAHPQRSCGVLTAVSGFYGREKLDLVAVIKWMGMRYSKRLTRRCTSLISRLVETEKTQTAKEWGIPVYSVDWLFARVMGECAGVHLTVTPVRESLRPVLPRVFLSDDGDDDDDVIFEEIERSLRKSPQRTSQLVSPKCCSSRVSPVRSPVAGSTSGKPELNFLGDSDDFDIDVDMYEREDPAPAGLTHPVESENIPDNIKSVADTIKSYCQRPIPGQRLRRTVPVQCDAWDTFTQLPMNSDSGEPEPDIGYVGTDDRVVAVVPDSRNDPLLAELSI